MNRTLAPVLRTVVVRCSAEHAFTVFTQQIGSWWPMGSHSVFPGDGSTVTMDDTQIVERAPDGRMDVWGEILLLDPPSELVFTWHPGRPEGPDTIVRVTFRPEGEATRVDLEHSGWEVFGDDAAERRSGYADLEGWPLVLEQFVQHVGPA
jgi:uncharacterized protein YndB with AHSA1/START domain